MIKLFVTDIDHTLYNSEHDCICEKNVQAINKLFEAGISVCFASSRNYDGTKKVADQFDLAKHNGYLVCLNGSKVERQADKKVLQNETFSLEQLRYLADNAKRLGVGFGFLLDNYCVCEEYSKIMHYDFESCGNEILLTKDVMKYAKEGRISQCSYYNDAKNMYELFDNLDDEMKNMFNCNVPQPPVLDISLPYVNKKFGIDAVVRDLGISYGEVAATGDNDNDIPMLKAAGISGCVANGSENAKKAATYQLASDYDGGVSEFIEKYILGANND